MKFNGKILATIMMMSIPTVVWGEKKPSYEKTLVFIYKQLLSANAKLIEPSDSDGDATITHDDYIGVDCRLSYTFNDPNGNKTNITGWINDLSVAYIDENARLDDEHSIIDLRGAMKIHEYKSKKISRYADSTRKVTRTRILLDSPRRATRVRNAFSHLIKLCPPDDNLPF